MDFFQIGFGLVFCALAAYFLFELHHFLRTFWCVVLANIYKKKVHILDETKIRGICLTTDIDSLWTHMNNARFIRELDFAKIDFLQRTGVFKALRKNGGSFSVGATTIRYRKFIKLFTSYMVTTKVIYWDEQNIYLEHRFVSKSDKFINAIVLCKVRFTDCNVEEMIGELLKVPEGGDIENAKRQKPVMPLELEKWIEYNEISSTSLRASSESLQQNTVE